MQSWNINPDTGDYILVDGKPEETNSLQVPAYFRLKTKRTLWMYAPDDRFGSDYFTVKKRPTTNSNERLESIGANALKPLLDDGRASEIELTTVLNVRNATGIEVKITDASGEVVVETFKGLGL